MTTRGLMLMLMFTISIAQISIWIWSNALYKFQRAQLNEVGLKEPCWTFRRSAPEHNPYMTSKQHSTTARWIRLESILEEGGNRSARRKPAKSGWDRLKLNPHTTFVVEVEGVIDVHYASLASPRVQHRMFHLDGHPSRYQPRPTGLNFGEKTGTGVFPLVIAVPNSWEKTREKWDETSQSLLDFFLHRPQIRSSRPPTPFGELAHRL